MKYCQGPECHTYKTKDRIRGPKGAKYYQTRRASSFNYMGGNACTYRCQDDWFAKFGEQAVNHFGRIHEPIKLTVENAWIKEHDEYDYNNRSWTYCIVNRLLGEKRTITEEQYNDNSFTLNT
tara:strand:- start:27 stop:392 length:366 start_codon:yes stop_codon:yes gene_type:complete